MQSDYPTPFNHPTSSGSLPLQATSESTVSIDSEGTASERMATEEPSTGAGEVVPNGTLWPLIFYDLLMKRKLRLNMSFN